MSTLVQDLRYGVRVLLRTPGFTAIVISVLALGIGANSAMFSVIDAVLLRPLPYHEPDRLYHVHEISPKGDPNGLPATDIQALAEHASALESAGFSQWTNSTVTGPEGAENIFGARVSESLFGTLGVHPALGRGFRPDDFKPGAPGAVILSDRMWERRFARNPAIIGRDLMLNGTAHTVIGVMARDFFYYQRFEFWTPMQLTAADLSGRDQNRMPVVVRLKPGVKPEQALAEGEPILNNIAPEDFRKGWRLGLTSVHDRVTSNSRPALLTALGAVGFVLLIACMNVANLLLARGSDRTRELAIRAALGAGRIRTFRQMLTESVLISTAGGAAGLLIGWAGARALLNSLPERMPIARLEQTRMDQNVLAFTAALAVVTGILFGLLPAWRASRTGIAAALGSTSRSAGPGKGMRLLRNGLIVVETALSMVLLIGAGLMLRSFQRMVTADPGFHAERVLTLRVPVPSGIKEPPQQMEYYTRLLDHVNQMPGLSAAGLVAPLPLTGMDANATFAVEGHPTRPGERQLVKLRIASPNYFTAMGVALAAGRVFNDSDTMTAPAVAVISESLAKRYIRHEDPIGKRVAFGPKGPWATVVGVVRDVKHSSLAGGFDPELYRPSSQYIFAPFATTLVVRTPGPGPDALAAAVQKRIRSFNPDQPINDVLAMPEIVSRSTAQPRFYTWLLGLFAAIAVVLAAAGLYGVLSYAVTQRTREIGIRVALGATRAGIARSVVGHAMVVVILGMTAGAVAALGLTRFLASQLYGIQPTDPSTYAGVGALLIAVAAIAAWIPARRATQVDPAVALRCE